MISYFDKVNKLLTKIETIEKDHIKQASRNITDCVKSNGVIHVFGCGHSHMLSEEVFYRAGGLVPINPIIVEELMLHKGPVRSSILERKNNYAQQFMEQEDIREGDILIVASTSGRNPVPIDVALYGKQKGAYVIGITSPSYANNQLSRHETGQFLYEVVDLVIDNHIPVGDFLMKDERTNITFGSASSIIGMYIINDMMISSIQSLLKNGEVPPVFKSGNVDGNEEYNNKLIDRYKERIPRLT